MKTALVVTLVICATVIVALPPLSDYLYNQTVAEILVAQSRVSVTLPGQMSSQYRFGCWLLGAAMMVAAISLGVALPDKPHTVRAAAATA